MKRKILIPLAAAASLFAGNAMAASFAVTPSAVNVPVASAPGTELVFTLGYNNTGTVASGIQTDVVFDGTKLTYVSHSGGGCTHPTATSVRVVRADLDGNPWPSGNLCTITVTVNATNNGSPWAAGDTAGLNITGSIISHGPTDHSGDLTTPTNAVITMVLEGPPTITFNTTPIALPAGVFGTTVSAPLPATITPGGGNDPTDTASFSCSATAGFTVAPTSGGPFQNGDSLPAITVSATLGASAQNGNVNCTATNTDGSSVPFQIPVSAPAGAQTAPALGATPASGSTIVLPAGQPGSTVSSNIRIAANGGVGQNAATVSCSASGAVTVNPTTMLSFLPGAAAQNVSVQCSLIEDAEQTGSVTCTGTDGNGSFTWNYDVVCPMGVLAPAIVPATSAWSKFALIALFAGLGVMLVGFRRQH